jgi:CubicO group peptidase (beta-lactamase class C family)
MSLLVDDNEKFPAVQWDTPINQLIRDDFVLEDDYYTNHITIEDSLSHRSGMPRHDKSYGGSYDGHDARVKDVVRSLRHLPLTAQPRTKFQYCNMMYVVASHLIEELTGSWLGDTLYEHIWSPLGMRTTFFSTKHAPKKDLAVGYYYRDGAYYCRPWPDLEIISGAGSVISNVLDYNKWAQALMRKTGPLSEKGHKAIWTPRTLIPEGPPYTGSRSYSLGWITGVYHGHQFYEHNGGIDAFGTEFILFPDINFSVIMFANTSMTSNLAERVLVFHLIDKKLGIPKEQRYDWTKE